MLTIYAIVKGFVGEFSYIQRNAIRSWRLALPGAEIVLFGDTEVGAQREAASFGLRILPMQYNHHGAPLLPSVVEVAHDVACHDARLFINADILLDPQFAQVAELVMDEFDDFLLIARRINVPVDCEIDFEDGWFERVRRLDRKAGNRSAIDFFCYRGDWLRDVPPFGVGRCAWDNWIVRAASKASVPIVDGTQMTKAWHQNHEKIKRTGEIKENRALLGKWNNSSGSLDAADWKLDEDGALVEKPQ